MAVPLTRHPLKLRMAKADPKWVRPHTLTELFTFMQSEQQLLLARVDQLAADVAALRARLDRFDP
jgi:hypothetical protein